MSNSEPSFPEPCPPMPALSRRDAERWARFQDGRFDSYEPHIFVQEVKGSKGAGFRTLGLKTGRVHHLLSQIEFNYFVILDSSSSVLDIREQFPLNPNETWEIAWALSVNHQTFKQQLVIPTIDFMITVLEGGKEVLKARDIKPASQISDQRSIEKLEISRRFCANHDIDYAICTDEDIPPVLVNNLATLRYDIDLKDRNIALVTLESVREYLECNLGRAESLSELAGHCDHALGRPHGESLSIARNLLIRGEWTIDLTKEFNPASKSSCGGITVETNERSYRHSA